jgi:hypothetical protein
VSELIMTMVSGAFDAAAPAVPPARLTMPTPAVSASAANPNPPRCRTDAIPMVQFLPKTTHPMFLPA